MSRVGVLNRDQASADLDALRRVLGELATLMVYEANTDSGPVVLISETSLSAEEQQAVVEQAGTERPAIVSLESDR